MSKFRNISIYPKVIDKKKLQKFTTEEKQKLTKKGFRWYVYYSFKEPGSEKYVRQRPIYLNVNRDFPEFDDRFREIHLMKDGISQALKQGFNPYDELLEGEISLVDALQYSLSIKKKEVGGRTYSTYEVHVNKFIDWIKGNGYSNTPVKKVSKRLVSRFLIHISDTTSNRTRNNYKTSLGVIFENLVQNEYLDRNIAHDIPQLKTVEKRDQTYSDAQVENIIENLSDDKVMLMFIYFVSYLFWRPKENCRLQVKDINLEQRLITEQTKTKGSKTKIIPEIIFKDLKEYLEGSNPNDLVFTPDGPGQWDRDLDGRRSYFTLKYRRLKKKMGIESGYTIYSFRHTFISRVYRNLRKEHNKDKTLELLSNITGHESKALLDYIHVIDADLPEDYSKYLDAL
ncbi:tyrosine-type recombinase/integrase [Leeuwenhoekiella sp. MAR_2009_132]|uniref:tyrosine-type recombinase/integrase n=1 Tax=Leeuwenhoekiella sp. MAR_2009_132 TaxID=1392489 RepID=UPI00048F5BC2|nr:tyrosine-type recombinase/integrase [Leeuwenhoekiella sp. MAR_2009_132]